MSLINCRLETKYRVLFVLEVAAELSEFDDPNSSGLRNRTFSHHKFQNIYELNIHSSRIYIHTVIDEYTYVPFLKSPQFKVQHFIIAKMGF